MNDIDQSGFVPRRSTQHAIAVAINTITKVEQLKKPLQLVAVDIESAFDSIDPQADREAIISLGYSKEFTEKYHELTTGGQVSTPRFIRKMKHKRSGTTSTNLRSRFSQQNMQTITYGTSTCKQKKI